MPTKPKPLTGPTSPAEGAAWAHEQGFAVAQAKPNNKLPRTKWKAQATRDERIIAGWWAGSPNANVIIACGEASDLLVIDCDRKGDVDGMAALRAEAERLGVTIPKTLTASTPSGGLHLYYRHVPGVTIGQNALPGVDWRGENGYVVGPGSTIDGKAYKVARPLPIVPCPDWIVALLKAKPAKAVLAPVAPGEPYPALEHDIRLRKAAVKLLRAGASHESVVAELYYLIAAHCPTPPGKEPYTDADIRERLARPLDGKDDLLREIRLVHSVTDPELRKTTPRYVDGYDPDTVSVPAVEGRARRFLTLADLDNLDPPEFLIDRAIVAEGDNMIVGRHSALKSATAQDMAVCIAAGIPWHGHAVKQGRVVYVCGEGLSGLRGRFAALRRHYGVEIDPDMLIVTDAVQLTKPEAVAELADGIGTAALIVLDTIARCAVGVEENSARDMGLVVAGLGELRRLTGAATLGIHHTGHDGEHGRGSSAVPGALDSEIKAMRDSDELTLKFTKARDWAEPDDLHLRIERDPFGGSFVLVESAGMSSTAGALGDLLDVWPVTIEAVPVRRGEAAARLKIDTTDANGRRAIGVRMDRLVTLGYCIARQLGTATNSPWEYELTEHGRQARLGAAS